MPRCVLVCFSFFRVRARVKKAENKKAFVAEGFFPLSKKKLLCFLLILVFEFLHAACCIHEQLLTGKERV